VDGVAVTRSGQASESLDRLGDLARCGPLTLLLAGSIHDASDEAQLAELRTLGELNRAAASHDCQVMIETPAIGATGLRQNAWG
jgi:hypothetical protein